MKLVQFNDGIVEIRVRNFKCYHVLYVYCVVNHLICCCYKRDITNRHVMLNYVIVVIRQKLNAYSDNITHMLDNI